MNHTPKGHITVRAWLKKNGYEDILEMIDEAMDTWKSEGNKTRRNWWEILAVTIKGNHEKLTAKSFQYLKLRKYVKENLLQQMQYVGTKMK